MVDSIWIVVNAGGNSRDKEIADEFNARACWKLTEQRIKDGADILAEGPFSQAMALKEGDRIVFHQGGGRAYRHRYGSGQLVASGYIHACARPLNDQDRTDFRLQYELARRYFPQEKVRNALVGIIFYSLVRAMQKLPIEQIGVRPSRGDKFIEIGERFSGYRSINDWWNINQSGRLS
jgi:hypothetical protein